MLTFLALAAAQEHAVLRAAMGSGHLFSGVTLSNRQRVRRWRGMLHHGSLQHARFDIFPHGCSDPAWETNLVADARANTATDAAADGPNASADAAADIGADDARSDGAE